MSFYAQAWAGRQQCGEWKGDKYHGNPGAKSVLRAIATYADENGIAYPSQETLERETEIADRTIRTHLTHLERKGLIKRKPRRRSDGTRTSDFYILQAPREELNPPAPSAIETDQVADLAGSTDQVAESARESVSIVDSEPSLRSGSSSTARECVKVLQRVKGFPSDTGANQDYVVGLMDDYPLVDALEVCKEYEAWHLDNPNKTKNYKSRLRTFFKTANSRAKTEPLPRGAKAASGQSGASGGTPAAGVEALKQHQHARLGYKDLEWVVPLAARYDFSSNEEPPWWVMKELNNDSTLLKRIRRVVGAAI